MKSYTFKMYCYFCVHFNVSENRKLRPLLNQKIKMVHTMLFENQVIKSGLSFTLDVQILDR